MPLSTQNRARLMITFAHIVGAGGISGAARAMGIDKAAVSRQLQELEDQLGVHLLHRGGPTSTLTEIGQSVYARATRLIDEVEGAVDEADYARDVPAGVLTVTTSVALGRQLLAKSLVSFKREHPLIDIELCLLDRYVHPTDEGFDVLLRICKEPPDDMVAHRLADVRYVLVATQEVLQKGQVISQPSDLTTYPCLFYGFKRRESSWTFKNAQGSTSVRVSTSLSINNGEVIREAALAGCGIALLPSFLVGDDIISGRLIPLLTDYEVQGDLGDVLYALHLPGRMLSPKVRAFVQHLKRDWLHNPWDDWRGQLPSK